MFRPELLAAPPLDRQLCPQALRPRADSSGKQRLGRQCSSTLRSASGPLHLPQSTSVRRTARLTNERLGRRRHLPPNSTRPHSSGLESSGTCGTLRPPTAPGQPAGWAWGPLAAQQLMLEPSPGPRAGLRDSRNPGVLLPGGWGLGPEQHGATWPARTPPRPAPPPSSRVRLSRKRPAACCPDVSGRET